MEWNEWNGRNSRHAWGGHGITYRLGVQAENCHSMFFSCLAAHAHQSSWKPHTGINKAHMAGVGLAMAGGVVQAWGGKGRVVAHKVAHTHRVELGKGFFHFTGN